MREYKLFDTSPRPAYDLAEEKARITYVDPQGKKFTIGAWLDRQRFWQDGTQHYIMYYGVPLTSPLDTVLPGSNLVNDPDIAAHFATRDRRLSLNQIKVYRVRVRPSEIEGGMWASARDAQIPLTQKGRAGIVYL